MRKRRIGLDLDGVIYNFISPFDYYMSKKGFKKVKDVFSLKERYDLKDSDNKNYISEFGKLRPFLWLPKYDEIYNRIRYAKNIEFYIITYRDWYKEGKEDTISALKRDKINYKEIVFSNDKAKYAKYFKLDYFIEDDLKNAIAISKYSTVMLIDRKYNKGVLNKNILRLII